MNPAEKQQHIEDYLSGNLRGKALLDFENKLKTDKAFQQEVQLHHQIAETLKGEKIHELRDVLKSVDQQWQQPKTAPVAKKAKTFSIPRLLAVAATVLLLVLAYQYFLPMENQSNNELFATHFEPYPMILNQRTQTSEDSAIKSSIDKAVEAYLRKDFAAAATAFEKIQQSAPNDVSLYQFYRAISELSLGNSNKAITILASLVKDPDSVLAEQSRWYLAMAYLQANNGKAAKKELEKIQKGTYKFKEAQKLLKTNLH